MADDKDQLEQDAGREKKASASNGSGFSMITWILLAGVVLVGSVGGFALSQLIGGPAGAAEGEQKEVKREKHPLDKVIDSKSAAPTWLYTLPGEPIVANLDEPGVTRYVRVGIAFEMKGELSQEKGSAYLVEKELKIRDQLNTYFANLSLEEVRGERNHNRIKMEVRDQLNKMLFPEDKPIINKILFTQIAIQ